MNNQIDYEKIRKAMVDKHKDKVVKLNKTYFVTEWCKSPLGDGIFVYKETIRRHLNINGIDCYFTNMNTRIYFKEDIFENKKEAEKVCKWKNSFSYDYNDKISRENIVKKWIDFDSACNIIYKFN